MKDKFLLGIVAGIVLLVVVAFVVVLTQPEPEYRTDDTPEAAVHNYLLAIRREEYERAYELLSPNLRGFPKSLIEFEDDVLGENYSFAQNRDVSLDVRPSTPSGNSARITVVQTTYRNGGIFDSGHATWEFTMRLRREGDNWLLVDGDHFWRSCWDRGDCR